MQQEGCLNCEPPERAAVLVLVVSSPFPQTARSRCCSEVPRLRPCFPPNEDNARRALVERVSVRSATTYLELHTTLSKRSRVEGHLARESACRETIVTACLA